MLKLILTLAIASLAVACTTTGQVSSQGTASDTTTMGAPGSTIGVGVQGFVREPANF